ncbi:uncharacterized protein LOC123223665 isoform X2 [Mangifera indica]|uniref:uncharacterized protein LOC123223665 isoform X2 n=1 Tax=Mangifera indica TaxID=29780 RepID=UPI001CFB003E|nr:uncharacterized protein LOC123223665 isoform X2 [Mangifera indica]
MTHGSHVLKKYTHFGYWFSEYLHSVFFCLTSLPEFLLVKAEYSSFILMLNRWTFVLVTFYFGFGSLLSIYGCYQYHKMISGNLNVLDETDSEKGNFMPLTNGENANKHEMRKVLNTQERSSPAIISYLFQVVYQMNAGAVMLTDCVYWLIIFPFLTVTDYKLSFMTVNMHTLNAVFLLCDTVLNCLQFPWFRIAYFLLWTFVFVIFQWILHAFVFVWWPYPFLDLSSPFAPLWYLGVGLMHIPCYGIFVFVARSKHYLLSRWFPQSYLCSK